MFDLGTRWIAAVPSRVLLALWRMAKTGDQLSSLRIVTREATRPSRSVTVSRVKLQAVLGQRIVLGMLCSTM